MGQENEIQEIWTWIGVKERMQAETKPIPVVLLPYGYLIKQADLNLDKVAKSLYQIALLQNKDIVIGPQFKASSEKEKDDFARAMQEFRNDMLYLKLAMAQGTIRL